ncbi:MAG: beta-N-acetylhexosaminidase [Alphaproteobacteria bacterium]|nr:beta-N-acetylhexosaminidase [Alphaproteobacteria bacterium]
MSKSNYSPVIFGIAGLSLSPPEIEFLSDVHPWGIILFARNIKDKAQLCVLTDSIKTLFANPDYPILIDQEGGRVMRLRPPLVRDYPAAALYGEIYKHNKADAIMAAQLGASLLAADLYDMGCSINCAPCLDLHFPATAAVIGDRAFSSDAEAVGILGEAFMAGLEAGGLLGMLKHLPGHGRATQDSHDVLPRISTSAAALHDTDFHPFRVLAKKGGKGALGMTGHLLFTDIDANQVSTFSATLIENVIRTAIGFDGLLMSDDISMGALSPADYGLRTTQCFQAGCDIVLHCNADMGEMQAIAASLPSISPPPSQTRMAAVASKLSSRHCTIDPQQAEKEWHLLRNRYKLS